MNKLSTLLTFLALASYAYSGAHAQKRKPELPMDTITSEIIVKDLLYRHPPKVENFSQEKVFACPVEEQPYFPGGTSAMYSFIRTNLRMPPAATKASVTGRVFTSFMIDVTGEISDVTVVKGIGFGCDAEAIRVVKSMPKWIPGKQSGKPVRVKYNLPISFKAE